MNGLKWASYVSTLNYVGGFSVIYNRAINFFNSPQTSIASGVVNKIQINTSNNINNPPISTFTLDQSTINPAVKFTGYFYASQSGNYTFTLGIVEDGVNSDIKDYGILFIGLANSNIVPNSTFTGNSSLSNIYPIIYSGSEIGRYSYTATVNLTAGNFYPILFYYNKGSNFIDPISIGAGNTYANINHQCGLYFSYDGGSPITDYNGYIYSSIPIVNGITYNVIENTQTVEVVASKGSPYTNTITIPNTVTMSDGIVYTVVSIGDSAFSNSGLTAITLTSSITSIGANTFENCGLTTIDLPSSITSIGDYAFYGCVGLTSITFTNSSILPNIQSDTFNNIGNNPVIYMTNVAYNNIDNISIFQLLLNNSPPFTLKTNVVQYQSPIIKSNYFTMKSLFSNNTNIFYKKGSGSSSSGSSGVRNAKIKYRKT